MTRARSEACYSVDVVWRPLVLGLLLVARCSHDDTAVDIRLIGDPNLNTAAQISAWVRQVVVVVDSDNGLYPPGSERTTTSYSIENTDDDDALELVVRVDVKGDNLPLVRLDQGGLPRGPLTLHIAGADANGTHVAAGGLSSFSFTPDRRETLNVAFNLKSDYLPPRVSEIYPRPNEQTCRAGVALLIFSKNVDPATVTPGASIVVTQNGDTTPLPANLAVDGPIVRLVWGVLSAPPTHYHISVTADIRDLEGLAFDQQPALDGAQGFVSDFDVVTTAMCTDYPYKWCHESGGPVECPDFRNGRLRCDNGVCVPHSCDGNACADGYVCDPAIAECVVDCRFYGGTEDCPGATMQCDQDTGVCSGP